MSQLRNWMNNQQNLLNSGVPLDPPDDVEYLEYDRPHPRKKRKKDKANREKQAAQPKDDLSELSSDDENISLSVSLKDTENKSVDAIKKKLLAPYQKRFVNFKNTSEEQKALNKFNSTFQHWREHLKNLDNYNENYLNKLLTQVSETPSQQKKARTAYDKPDILFKKQVLSDIIAENLTNL